MELTQVWILLIAVLWTGYFILEGFDFGVGILMPFVAKDERERRVVLTTLGPVWDGNEVWLLVAGGATFAAFPEWYATLFSGFSLPLLLILLALIIRGVAFEYRSKRSDPTWRKRWDAAIFIGSFVPALLWGVAFANLIRGVPMELNPNGGSLYTGGFFNLLNPYALLGGLTTLTLFMTHGATFLSLKTEGPMQQRASKLSVQLGVVSLVILGAFALWTQVGYSDKVWTWIPLVVAALAWIAALGANRVGKHGMAFLWSSITMVGSIVLVFGTLYPDVMRSSADPEATLTIYNASSTPYTLKIMTVVALILTPIVLGYQAWTYWVFRKRVLTSQIADPDVGSLDLPDEAAKHATPAGSVDA